jgi:hypothetical protein
MYVLQATIFVPATLNHLQLTYIIFLFHPYISFLLESLSANATMQNYVWDVMVVSVLNEGNLINVRLEYTSSGRRTSTPTSTWVSYKALPILMSESELGAKKLQKRLQEKYNIVIRYDMVWKGKEKSMAELYGTWEKNFK